MGGVGMWLANPLALVGLLFLGGLQIAEQVGHYIAASAYEDKVIGLGGSHRSLVGGGHGVVGGALQLMDLAFLGHYMFVDGPVGGGLSPVVDSIF